MVIQVTNSSLIKQHELIIDSLIQISPTVSVTSAKENPSSCVAFSHPASLVAFTPEPFLGPVVSFMVRVLGESTGQLFSQMSFHLSLPDVLTRFRFCIFGRTIREVMLPSSQCIQEAALPYTGDVDLDLLGRGMSAKFLHCEVPSTSPPLLHYSI